MSSLSKEQKLEILCAARESILTPATWTQKAYARDAQGQSVDYDGADAVSFCGKGALYCQVLKHTKRQYAMDELLDEISIQQFDNGLAHVNDFIGHVAVLDVYARAIKQVRDEA